jgi:hypothetical protein
VPCHGRQGRPRRWPCAGSVLHPAPPSASPSREGQPGVEGSPWRGAPHVGPRRGGGPLGGWGTGAWAGAPAVQRGWCGKPGPGGGARPCFLGGMAGGGVACPLGDRPRGLRQAPAIYRHRRASRRTSSHNRSSPLPRPPLNVAHPGGADPVGRRRQDPHARGT